MAIRLRLPPDFGDSNGDLKNVTETVGVGVREGDLISATITFALPLQERGTRPTPDFDEIEIVVHQDETVSLCLTKIATDGLRMKTEFEGYALTNIRDPVKFTSRIRMALSIDRTKPNPEIEGVDRVVAGRVLD